MQDICTVFYWTHTWCMGMTHYGQLLVVCVYYSFQLYGIAVVLAQPNVLIRSHPPSVAVGSTIIFRVGEPSLTSLAPRQLIRTVPNSCICHVLVCTAVTVTQGAPCVKMFSILWHTDTLLYVLYPFWNHFPYNKLLDSSNGPCCLLPSIELHRQFSFEILLKMYQLS